MDEDDYDEDCVRMFRELTRNFRHTVVDDYCKNGRWLREHLEIDLELVLAHRRHAGAGEPRPLEEIPIPRLPTPRRLPLPPAPPPPAATEIGEGRLATRSARPASKSLAQTSAYDRYVPSRPARSRSPTDRATATAMREPARHYSPERHQNGSTAPPRPRPTTAWPERQHRRPEPTPATRARTVGPSQGDSLPPWKGPRTPPASSWSKEEEVQQFGSKHVLTKPGSLIASLLG